MARNTTHSVFIVFDDDSIFRFETVEEEIEPQIRYWLGGHKHPRWKANEHGVKSIYSLPRKHVTEHIGVWEAIMKKESEERFASVEAQQFANYMQLKAKFENKKQ